jgi:hypothetical protein
MRLISLSRFRCYTLRQVCPYIDQGAIRVKYQILTASLKAVVHELSSGRPRCFHNLMPSAPCLTLYKAVFIIIRGSYNRLISGRRTEWTQLDSTPH